MTTEPEVCEYCHERPAAFRVKHEQTSRHWRCLGCTRSMGGVLTVSGVRVGDKVTLFDVDLVMEAMGLTVVNAERPPEFVAAVTNYRTARLQMRELKDGVNRYAYDRAIALAQESAFTALDAMLSWRAKRSVTGPS